MGGNRETQKRSIMECSKMGTQLKQRESKAVGRPPKEGVPIEDKLFAALLVITDSPAKAFKTLRPTTQNGHCQEYGTLRMQQPGVDTVIAQYRALLTSNKAEIAQMSLEEADRDMIDTLLAITRSPDATATDKAKAATSYVALRKGLGTGNNGESPQAGDMGAFIKTMAAPGA